MDSFLFINFDVMVCFRVGPITAVSYSRAGGPSLGGGADTAAEMPENIMLCCHMILYPLSFSPYEFAPL